MADRLVRLRAGARAACRATLACFLLAGLPAHAGALRLDDAPAGPLGKWAAVLQEDGQPIDVATAAALARAGRFSPGTREVPAFGINARPVWLHLALDNPAGVALARRIVVGTPWIDRLDVYLVREGAIVAGWSAGDADASLQRAEPALGYTFEHRFEPGRTELLVRASTPDPLALPLRVLAPGDATALEQHLRYSYGALYGFLAALIAYNALLYAGLRARSHLDYLLYLGTFVLMNLAYTGHGYAWLWPEWPALQRYVILLLMVAFAASGLRFASGFLELDRLAPRLARGTRLFNLAGFVLIGLAMLAGRQGFAALVAFTWLLAFTIGMVGLGLIAVRLRQESAGYFLAAALCGMAGAATTALAVWGGLPFTVLTYRAVEVGVLLEATLLALALAYQIRQHQHARRTAERLASTDPLTGLLNRRAFVEQAQSRWLDARRGGRPMTIVLLDLDHFKAINDTHGHAAGDRALERTATLLGEACRRGDLAGRWGGEEFILLLLETTLAQAMAFAERLRLRIAALPLEVRGPAVRLSASLGVAELASHDSLEALVADADAQLYRSKREGRGRVSGLA